MNTIHNTDAFTFLETLSTGSVDITFTSPPYNRRRDDTYDHYSDTIEDYFQFLSRLITESLRVTRRHTFLNIQTNYYNRRDVLKVMGQFADDIQENFIWGKTNPKPSSGNSITNSYEMILVLGKTPLRSKTTYTKNLLLTSVGKSHPEHRAVMNTQVAEFFISKFAHTGDLILDPFMGTGTTALVARNFGCNYIGSEIVPRYIEIATQRLNLASQPYLISSAEEPSTPQED